MFTGKKQIFPNARDSSSLENFQVDAIDTSTQLFKDTSCDDLTLFPADTDLNEKMKGLKIPTFDVQSTSYIIPVIKRFLSELSAAVDLDEEHTTLEAGLEKYLHNEGETDRASVALELKSLLKDENFVSDGHRSCRILKACNQASIAPFVSSLKMGLGSSLHFNSVRNSWKIDIVINPSSTLVTHDMAEKITDIDSGEIVCTFYWQARILFDQDVLEVKLAEFDISRVAFDPRISKSEEKTMLNIFKKYGYVPTRTTTELGVRSNSEGSLSPSSQSTQKKKSFFQRIFTDPNL